MNSRLAIVVLSAILVAVVGNAPAADFLFAPKGVKPTRITNPKHHPNSVSPEPANAGKLYENAIHDSKSRAWWAKDENGVIHRFAPESNGQTHWNGSTAGGNPIRMDDIPIEIRRALK